MAVGVIMPVRLPATYLREALASVLEQDPAPDEVVLVDDASERPVAAPEGVVLVRREVRGGPAAARQSGLEATRADLIALADADDVWLPGKLAAQLEALATHRDAAVCFGRATVIGADGSETGERLPELPRGAQDLATLRRELFERDPIPAATVVVRRSALEAAGGFTGAGRDLPAGSDWELWLRLLRSGQGFFCEPRARALYRRHAGGLTSDVARLAEAGLAIHELHADLVDDDLRRRVRASDLTSLARGRVRQRRYAEARAALAEAAALEPPGARERAMRVVLAVPGLRAALGRRDPYRRARY